MILKEGPVDLISVLFEYGRALQSQPIKGFSSLYKLLYFHVQMEELQESTGLTDRSLRKAKQPVLFAVINNHVRSRQVRIFSLFLFI